MSLSYLALAAATAAQAAVSQPATQAAAVVTPASPQAVIVGASNQNVLRAGAEVPLRMEESLDSNNKALREGQQVRMHGHREELRYGEQGWDDALVVHYGAVGFFGAA